MTELVAERLNSMAAESVARKVSVLVSYEVIKLFSDQLYTTPVKAIEELVVNSWDADARHCSVLIDTDGDDPRVAVFDDGQGMSLDELENLWHIGVSLKSEQISIRKQIGKFGIGKLASYSVANRATYISKKDDQILAVTINFEDFAAATDKDGLPSPVVLQIRKFDSYEQVKTELLGESVQPMLNLRDEDPTDGPGSSVSLDPDKIPSWTLVLLESLKPKASQLKGGRLRWVLETAMPLASDFALYFDSLRIVSSKLKGKLVEFGLQDLEQSRLDDLAKSSGEKWTRTETGLVSPNFPSGVTGIAYVTKKSLYAEGGKSEDLGRSHGFFVRVRNRLVNETDPLFGARPLSFTTFYRFAAVIEAEDLNAYVTASRDDVEQSRLKQVLRQLLIQVFYQARDLYDKAIEKQASEDRVRKEGQLDYVSTDLVERPLADALATSAENLENRPPPDETAESSIESWRYLEDIGDIEGVRGFVDKLYDGKRKDRKYVFHYSPAGEQAPLVKLDAVAGSFTINEDHELVQEFGDQDNTRRLLELLATAEAMLEVYLRETQLDLRSISHLMDKRDLLLRSLAVDESISLKALAGSLRSSAESADELEIALVGALRALGFAATHIGGPGTPDGEATYVLYGAGATSITLEAKSSGQTPSLGQLDFGGLRSHYLKIGSQGCLLVAPTYPGINDPKSEVSTRAIDQGVSCWTIEQLARVVEAAETRHINAPQIQDIVLSAFSPLQVAEQIEQLLSAPVYSERDVYQGVMRALRDLQPRLKGRPRDVSMLAAEISRNAELETIDYDEVLKAVTDLAKSSRGMLHVSQDGDVQVLGDLDELDRRVQTLTGSDVLPRRKGSFRADGA